METESDQKLRYIHRVNGGTHVYFFVNIGDTTADAVVRLRGKIKPDTWDPHTGRISAAEYSQTLEDGQPVTKVRLTLSPVHSVFIIGE